MSVEMETDTMSKSEHAIQSIETPSGKGVVELTPYKNEISG